MTRRIAPSVSVEPRIDGGSDLSQRFASTVQSECHATLALTDMAIAGHAVALIATQEGVEPLFLRTTAVAPNAVHDLRNLPDLIERGDRVGRVLQLLVRQHVRRVDSRTWRG